MESVVENPASESIATPGFARKRARARPRARPLSLRPRSPALSPRPVSRRGRVWLLRQQAVTVDHCRGNVDELPVRGTRLLTQQLEGRRLIDRVAFHEDALRTLGDGAAAEGALEIVVLGEAAQDDVDRALPVDRLGVGDVGEHAA